VSGRLSEVLAAKDAAIRALQVGPRAHKVDSQSNKYPKHQPQPARRSARRARAAASRPGRRPRPASPLPLHALPPPSVAPHASLAHTAPGPGPCLPASPPCLGQADVAKVSKAHNDLIRVYEAKLAQFGVPPEELGFRPLVTTTALGPAGLVSGR
jgi:hypothetical protein